MLQNEPKAPYVRNRDSAFTVMMDVVVALLPLYFMAFYFYGLRALMLGLASVAAAVISDLACVLLEGKRPYPRDISSVVTGMILPLMMSAATPYYVVVSASVFAIVLVKHVFGGVGQSAFNPAAAGFAFAAACWPSQVFSYPAPFSSPAPFGAITEGLASGPAWSLFQGGVPTNDILDLLLGKFLGPMGLTNILVLATCLFYLLFRGAIGWQAPAAFFGIMVVAMMLFPRIPESGPMSLVYESTAGMWIFGGIFMLNEPGTLPKRSSSRIAYGALAAIFTILFQRFGRVEQTFAFALLLTNVFGFTFDRYSERLLRRLRRVYLATRTKLSEKKSAQRA
ncbi:MAG: RnfABCDGE type electron transport complex subunit D [Oscillospiraceae bacterium]|nr:RnfABCDGE type electron transport complex subunit D [Oscillospiraceae bacterium]